MRIAIALAALAILLAVAFSAGARYGVARGQVGENVAFARRATHAELQYRIADVNVAENTLRGFVALADEMLAASADAGAERAFVAAERTLALARLYRLRLRRDDPAGAAIYLAEAAGSCPAAGWTDCSEAGILRAQEEADRCNLIRWTERTFPLDVPIGLFPVIVERLRGTPARVAAKVAAIADQRDVLTWRDGKGWSFQEHVGHLVDLEDLHDGRLDDFASGAEVLRPADMTNAKTNGARHNARFIDELVADLYQVRRRFIARLEALDDQQLQQPARHPRLDQPMRVVDMAHFVAEHDDHHLALMTAIKRKRGVDW